MNEHFDKLAMKKIIISTAAATAFMAAAAGNIGYDKAARIASRYVEVTSPQRTAAPGKIDAEKPYYIFNDKSRGNGFVIIAGDENISPVLGYSEHGYIDENNMPDALRYWLDAVELGIVQPMAQADEPATPVVAPLVKTKWYQLAPYNEMLPSASYLTGCVATAMAQIIKYHQWPERGHGSGSYVSFYGEDDAAGLIPYDLSPSVYDFDNMRDIYLDGNWSDAEADAVALLMRDCGFATHMQYTSSESSSFDQDCATAMSENFGYDAKVFTHFGTYRDTQKWVARMKEEFDNGFPVIMNGQATPFGGGGHCFIADGYDSNGFMHINWGWNGDADGYYNVCALTTNHNGKQHTYSYMQNFITVHPRYPYFEAAPYNPDLWMLWDPKHNDFDHSGLTVENEGEAITADNPAMIRLDGIFCNSLRAYNGLFKLDLLDADGVKVRTLCSSPLERDEIVSEDQGQYFPLKDIQIGSSDFAGVPDGSYIIVPVSEAHGMEPKPVQVYGYKDRLIATVKNGVATLSNVPAVSSRLRYVKPFEIPSEATLFTTVNTEVTIANDGDNIDGGKLFVYISYADDSQSVLLKSIPVAVYEHSEINVPVSFDILPRYKDYKNFVLEEGKKYKAKVVFENYSGEVQEIQDASQPVAFTVKIDHELVPHLEITSVKVSDTVGNELDINDLRLDLTKQYTVEYTYNPVGKGVLPGFVNHTSFVLDDMYEQSHSNQNLTWIDSYDIDFFIFFVEPGQSSIKLRYTDFLTDELVPPLPEAFADIPVTLYDSLAGVDDVISGGVRYETARYDARGVRLSAPVKGINIVVYSDGSVVKEVR